MSSVFTVVEGHVVLQDQSGNTVGVASDGAVFRLQTETRSKELQTYLITSADTATASNKSMLSIFNVSSSITVKIQEMWLINVKTATVTGVPATFSVRRLSGSAPTSGTDLSTSGVESFDSTNSVVPISGLDVRTNATVSGESTKRLRKVVYSTDEWVAGTVDAESHQFLFQNSFPLFRKANDLCQSIVLRQNEGITVKCETSTTTGQFDLMAIVTVE